MRMIRADDRASARPDAPDGREVVRRINLIRDGTGPDVAGANVLVNKIAVSDEEPAALERRLVPGVAGNPGEYWQLDPHRQASTIMAVPMPPPMHNDAAPRPPPRACSE